MSAVSAIVLFWVIWFVALLCVIPVGLRTQGETGEVAAGTPSSAPVNPMIRRKALWTTVITLALWGPLCAFIIWGGVTVRDLDFFGRMGPPPHEAASGATD